jgi:hypothetical protein
MVVIMIMMELVQAAILKSAFGLYDMGWLLLCILVIELGFSVNMNAFFAQYD